MYPSSLLTLSVQSETTIGLSKSIPRLVSSRETFEDLQQHYRTAAFSLVGLNMWWRVYEGCSEILKIQKFRRMFSYAGFYCFVALISYAYTNNTTRAGYSRADQFYASYPAGTELLVDTTKLYKAALGHCFEEEEWGPVEWSILAKHFERQGKSPYAYHAQYMAHLASHGQLDGSG